jgi:hypothetical protein
VIARVPNGPEKLARNLKIRLQKGHLKPALLFDKIDVRKAPGSRGHIEAIKAK